MRIAWPEEPMQHTRLGALLTAFLQLRQYKLTGPLIFIVARSSNGMPKARACYELKVGDWPLKGRDELCSP